MENVYNMEISEPWFTLIKEGKKKVEMRKNNPENWGKVKMDDVLIINVKGDKNNIFEKRVSCVRIYEGLIECFESEGISNLLPGLETIDDGFDVYLRFDGQDKIEERRKEFEKYGCIAIELEDL